VNMIQDLAGDAYSAARDRDAGTVELTVNRIISRGQADLDFAMRLWMDRTIIAMSGGGMRNKRIRLKVGLESEHATDATGPAPQLPQDVTWTGEFFLAYANQDRDLWRELWEAVPPDDTFTYVKRLLTTMTLTALSYQDDPDPPGGCWLHRMISADPVAAGDRAAKAHLN
jgi:hypothetical protein